MKSSLKLVVASAFALLISLPMLAQIPEASILPVTEPLDVGGTILQPGDYMIRVLPSDKDRNKVQITSPDRKTVYATVLTIPHALEPNEQGTNSTFVFYPAGEGQPRALRTWFAADTTVSQGGHDVVYPAARALQLARLANSRVVSYRDETAVADLDTTELQVVTPEAKVETYTYAAPTPRSVTDKPVPMISSEPEMPSTASRVPLIALLGLVSLAGAAAFRMSRA